MSISSMSVPGSVADNERHINGRLLHVTLSPYARTVSRIVEIFKEVSIVCIFIELRPNVFSVKVMFNNRNCFLHHVLWRLLHKQCSMAASCTRAIMKTTPGETRLTYSSHSSSLGPLTSSKVVRWVTCWPFTGRYIYVCLPKVEHYPRDLVNAS